VAAEGTFMEIARAMAMHREGDATALHRRMPISVMLLPPEIAEKLLRSSFLESSLARAPRHAREGAGWARIATEIADIVKKVAAALARNLYRGTAISRSCSIRDVHTPS
jgi:hypothetical protein